MKRPGLVAAVAAGAIGSAAMLTAARDDPGRDGSPLPRATTEAPATAPATPRQPRPRRARRPARPRAQPRSTQRARRTRRRDPRTVLGAVRRAHAQGRIGSGDARSYARRYRSARAALRRLGGTRALELRAVVGGAERLASRGRLSAGRMPAVFLELVRNARFWSRRSPPLAGTRFTFGGDPAVLQYYPGQGLRFQPLATASEANALYNACRGYRTRPGTPCRRRTLRRTLDRLVELSSRRGRFRAWEYYFSYEGGEAPWVSGMAQGTAIQALARGARHLGRPGYLRAAREALGVFEAPPPVGVALPDGPGTHYAMYSARPGLRILNGFLQAVAGLQTYARVSGDRRGWRLFRAGDRAARRALPYFDTGGWSLYSRPGGESTLEYHRLVRDFLGNLCRRAGGRPYCRTAARFTRYLTEPPRLHVRPVRGARAGRPLRLRFRLSRSARVTVAVRSEGGRLVFRRRIPLGRGTHTVTWTPRSGRRYRVQVAARDGRGLRSAGRREARVRSH